MSSVWGTRYRLLLEQCEELADRLSAEEPGEPAVIEGQAVRLLMSVVGLLRQHQVDKRGQCRYCGWTRWGWRLWRRRPRCTVYRAVDFAMSQDVDVVWWQLFNTVDRPATLEEVRAWLEGRSHADSGCADSAENETTVPLDTATLLDTTTD